MPRLLLLFMAASFFALGGCRARTELSDVEGKVTLKSTPLDKGYITFFPVGGPGDAFGAEIVNGSYKLKDVPAGKRKVLITRPGRISMDGGKAKLVSADPISPMAVGNNRIVEVGPGKQTVNIEL